MCRRKEKLMANRNKQRGYELERETVLAMQANGVPCQRVFGSGAFKAAHQDLEGDLKLGPYTVECKRKKSGYKFLYQSLDQDGADLLCVREDRQRRLWIMEEATLLDLLERAGIKSV
jgi:hypothetical protein